MGQHQGHDKDASNCQLIITYYGKTHYNSTIECRKAFM